METSLSGYLQKLKRCPALISEAVQHRVELEALAQAEVRRQLLKSVSGRQENTRGIFPNSLFLFEEEDVVVSLRRLGERSRYVYLIPRQAAFLVVTGKMTVEEYKVGLPDGRFDTNVYTGDEVAVPHRSASYGPGEIYVGDGPDAIFDISGSGTVISIYAGLHGRVDWTFDRATGRALGVAASDPRDTDIEALLGVVRDMGPNIEESAILPHLEHQSHFVRWTALQALNEINPENAAEWLTRLSRDPHPEIANTASSLLQGVHS